LAVWLCIIYIDWASAVARLRIKWPNDRSLISLWHRVKNHAWVTLPPRKKRRWIRWIWIWMGRSADLHAMEVEMPAAESLYRLSCCGLRSLSSLNCLTFDWWHVNHCVFCSIYIPERDRNAALTHSVPFTSLLTLMYCLTLFKLKLRGLSPHANYTDRAAAAGRRS